MGNIGKEPHLSHLAVVYEARLRCIYNLAIIRELNERVFEDVNIEPTLNYAGVVNLPICLILF
jgi:hypothetical protein